MLKKMLLTVSLLLVLISCGDKESKTVSTSGVVKKDLRFVIVPKVVHPWFDEVNKGAQKQARLLSEQLGVNVEIDYRAPAVADVTEQNAILSQSASTKPDGIALDPLDYAGNKAIIDEIRALGIPVVVFDSPVPEGSDITSIGNNFTVQAALASERLVEILGGKGKVAIMQGVPTAGNHRERYLSHKAVFAKYPGIEIVAEGIDNDDIQTAQQQAAAIIAANPDINGFVACDASGPIGIALAVQEANKQGEIVVVGLDNLIEILEAIKDGTLDSTSSTIPQMQGSMAVLMMWQASLGMDIPKIVDTGIDFINIDNVDEAIKKISEQ